MSGMYVIAAILAVGLTLYLFVALLYPEKLQ
jgi:K+-transporting ATPase KdpF subunit